MIQGTFPMRHRIDATVSVARLRFSECWFELRPEDEALARAMASARGLTSSASSGRNRRTLWWIGVGAPVPTDGSEHAHAYTAWRLRHQNQTRGDAQKNAQWHADLDWV
jgi:hypothetical protein